MIVRFAIVLLFVIPCLADAQQYDVTRTWTRCIDPVGACAELSLRTTWEGDNDTRIRVGIMNLQGMSPFDTSGAWLLASAFFIAPQSQVEGTSTFIDDVSVYVTGAAVAPRYPWSGGAVIGGMVDGIFLSALPPNGIGGESPTPRVYGWSTVMDGQTPDPSSRIFFEFVANARWDARDFSTPPSFLSIHPKADGSEETFACDTYGACVTMNDVTVDHGAPIVTPEPVSVILIASGLAGIAAARSGTRRKRA